VRTPVSPFVGCRAAFIRGARSWLRFRRDVLLVKLLNSLTLGTAVGVAALVTVAAFGLARALPIREPDALVSVTERGYAYPRSLMVSGDDCRRLLDGLAPHVDGAFGVSWLSAAVSTESSEVISASVEVVTARYFAVLGISPLGAVPTEGSRAGVISHRLAVRLFGRDDQALGRVVFINGVSARVDGVAPYGFDGVWAPKNVPIDVWILADAVAHFPSTDRPSESHRYQVRIRLRDDVSSQAVTPVVQSVLEGLGKDRRTARNIMLSPAAGRWLHPSMNRIGQGLVLGAGAAAALLLLVAGINAAIFAVADLVARRGEIAVRLAVGGSRRLVAVEFIGGQCVQWIVAGVSGFVLALSLGAWLSNFQLVGRGGVPLQLGIRAEPGAVLAATALWSFASWTVTAVMTAVMLSRAHHAHLREGLATTGRQSLLDLALVLQVGTACAFVTAGGAFVEHFATRVGLTTSVDMARTFQLNVRSRTQASGLPDPTPIAAALSALGASPGAVSASAASDMPFSGRTRWISVQIARRQATWRIQGVAAGYFNTLGVPLLRGREFTDSDVAGRDPFVIIDQVAANVLSGDTTAIGQMISYGVQAKTAQVIGVVARDNLVAWDEPMPGLFVPLTSEPTSQITFFARYRSPNPNRGPVEAAVRSAFGTDSVDHLTSLRERWTEGPTRLVRTAALSGVWLAFAATAIAMWGAAAVVSHAVTRRRRDIGIRLALGASKRHVLWAIGRWTLLLVVTGATAGVVLSRWASSLAVSLSPNALQPAPGVFWLAAAVVCLACGVAWLASYRPAVRDNVAGLLRNVGE
jgi:hypothetical protein